ncbi:hypothetical protein H4Q26_000698 [Puccinia striiformis f. sp. tritici PST-130]|nr:hypothetical protein H4Q26_000698 [Puccinia striiformis f. sp. tritici PST-130]
MSLEPSTVLPGCFEIISLDNAFYMQPVPPPLGEGSGGIPHVECQPTGGHVTRSSGSDKRCQDTTLGAVRLGLGSKLGEEREETGTGTAEGRTEYKGYMN